MSLGNGNPKEGDKGSNFNYELKVLQGLEAIAVALENVPPVVQKKEYEVILSCMSTRDPVTIDNEIQNTTGYTVQIDQPTAGTILISFLDVDTNKVLIDPTNTAVLYNNQYFLDVGQKYAAAIVNDNNEIELRSYYVQVGGVPNPPDNFFQNFYLYVKIYI